MMRAVASVPPPAPHGTISVTGRSGQAACAAPPEQGEAGEQAGRDGGEPADRNAAGHVCLLV